MGKYVLEDKEFGRLIIREIVNGRRIIIRMKMDGLHITAPLNTPFQIIRKALKKSKDSLQKMKENLLFKLIDLNFRIDAPRFKLSLEEGTQPIFLERMVGDEHILICPPGTCFNDIDLQQWLHKVIEEKMKQEARRFLLPRIEKLSMEANLPFSSVKVNGSTSHWGSCSVRRTINLSCYLMLLPDELIDYVMLHELCHTKEMNHGEDFWKLMDKVTGNRTAYLREQIRHYCADFI